MELLNRLARDYVLGRVGPEGLPMGAAEALARGVDSASLRELAGLRATGDVRDIRDVVVAAMGDFGIKIPSVDAGRWEYVEFWARQVVYGGLSPREGASMIAGDSSELGESEGLWEVYRLVVIWDDEPARRESLDESMRRVICDLL